MSLWDGLDSHTTKRDDAGNRNNNWPKQASRPNCFNGFVYKVLSVLYRVNDEVGEDERALTMQAIRSCTRECTSYLLDELTSSQSRGSNTSKLLNICRLYYTRELDALTRRVLQRTDGRDDEWQENTMRGELRRDLRLFSATSSFEHIDDLMSLRRALVSKALTLSGGEHEQLKRTSQIKDHLCDIYEASIDNAIRFERFQVKLNRIYR